MSQQPQEPDDPTRGPRGFRGRKGKEGPEGPEGPASDDEELLVMLKRVGSDVAFRQKTRRWIKMIAAIAIVALLGALISLFAVGAVRYVQKQACERDNELRKAYTNQWEPILSESPLPEPPPEGAPQEAVDAYNVQIKQRATFEASLDAFAQHPC